MKKNPVETFLGILIVFVAVLFVYFSAKRIDVHPFSGYPLHATFLKTGGLETGNDVRINGIKIGTVASLKLTEDYTADVELTINGDVILPADSEAAIVGDGLMGAKFVQIEPGKDKRVLKAGDTLTKTKNFKSIEDLVGEVIFMVTGSDEKK